MKLFIVLALFATAALAAPAPGGPEADAQIVSQSSDNIGTGQYANQYETSNGISAQEQGQLKNVGSENEALEVRGQFSYTGTDGLRYLVEYIANELGFQPSAAHLPKSP